VEEADSMRDRIEDSNKEVASKTEGDLSREIREAAIMEGTEIRTEAEDSIGTGMMGSEEEIEIEVISRGGTEGETEGDVMGTLNLEETTRRDMGIGEVIEEDSEKTTKGIDLGMDRSEDSKMTIKIIEGKINAVETIDINTRLEEIEGIVEDNKEGGVGELRKVGVKMQIMESLDKKMIFTELREVTSLALRLILRLLHRLSSLLAQDLPFPSTRELLFPKLDPRFPNDPLLPLHLTSPPLLLRPHSSSRTQLLRLVLSKTPLPLPNLPSNVLSFLQSPLLRAYLHLSQHSPSPSHLSTPQLSQLRILNPGRPSSPSYERDTHSSSLRR